MKNFILAKLLNLVHVTFIAIDRVIELKLFKPVAISIITIFFITKGSILLYSNLSDSFIDFQKDKAKKLKYINIKFDEKNLKFDLSQDQIFNYKVKAGDTILKILIDLGANENEIFSLLSEMKKIYDPRSIVKGDELRIVYDLSLNLDQEQSSNIQKSISLKSLSIELSSDEKIRVKKTSNGSYKAQKIKIDLIKSIERYYGTINNGLYIDGVNLGISSNVMMNMINLYGYDIDFQRDIRAGDKFEIIVETFYDNDGKKIRDGNIIFASIFVRNSEINMFAHRYRDRIEYFNAKGNSIKKSLLKTPINGARVSSNFGMRRHPILGYSRMHKGIDFAARSGTPILAAGSGIITFRGRNGGYGNYIRIKHNSEYSTSYAHASRFNPRFKNGSRVKQGDVIAYVGTTGRSTGPHLHFEVIKNGLHINPSKVKASSGIMLKGKDYKEFVENRDKIEMLRKNIPNSIYISE